MSSPPPSKGSKRQRFRNAIRHGLDVILPSRPTSPNPAASNIAWNGLETALRVLETSADAFPPLKSAVGRLLTCLDIIQAATTNHEDYQELTSELTTMAGILNQYMTKLGSEDPGSSAARIARSIGNEVDYICQKQGRGKGRRVLESIQDKEDITKRYRKIEALFRQLQSDVSLRAWETTDKHFKMSLLERISPADDARYNSSYSRTIKRRGCTSETREKVQTGLKDWVRDPNAAEVYWMNGMAGTGKTTIAYSLCEWLEENHLLGASFFCSRVSSSCRNVNHIVPTIASQLARYSPAFQSSLCKILEDDPNIGKLDLVWQFKRLVQEPMQDIKRTMPEGVVVVIDALDECDDVHGVRLVLEMLLKLAADLPLRFFVTSRPEPAIREKMLSPGGYRPSVLHLHDIEESIVEEDIKKYLTEELSSMPSPPSPDDIERLVKRAGKLFIYAATIVRYVLPGDVHVNSNARLKAMLATSPQGLQTTGPNKRYEELDTLYTGILAAAFDPKRLEAEEIDVMQLVLSAVVCAMEPMIPKTLATLLRITEPEVSSALQPLQSVLHVSEAGGVVSVLHASFPDFIFDRSRSSSFHFNKAYHNGLLAHRCFDAMKEGLRFNICGLDSSSVFDMDVPGLEQQVRKCISSALFYSCQYWGNHLQLGDISTELLSKLADFLAKRLLFWMEVLNLRGCMVRGAEILLQAHNWLLQHAAVNDIKEQAADAQVFVTRLAAGACTRSTPHIYISALPFCPRSNFVYKNYWGSTEGLMEVKGTAIRQREGAALATWMTSSYIRSAKFSPDGTRIVSGSDDGAIRVWDARTGAILAGPLEGHSGAVLSVLFSPDGTRIVSASADHTIRVWDAQTGDPVAGPLQGHVGKVWSVELSANGTRIVSGSGDCTIRLWDAETGDVVAEPFQEDTEINTVSFSPDSTQIVSGSDDNAIHIWDAHTGKVVAGPLEGHTDKVRSVAFSPDGTRITSGSDDCTLRVWDVCTGGFICGPFEGHTKGVNSVAFSPDGSRIVSCSDDQTIRIWDTTSSNYNSRLFEGHTDVVHSVAFSPDGTRIVSGSLDRSIRVWDARPTHTVAGQFHGHTNSVHSVSFSPDGSRIVSGSHDCTIRVWDCSTGEATSRPLKGHGGAVYSVSFSPDGSRIISCSADHTLRIWDADTGDSIAGPLKGHTDMVCSVAFSLDGNHIVSGSLDCSIRMWDANTSDTIVGPLKGHTRGVRSVAFSPDGTRIASGSYDHTIRTWDVQASGTLAGVLNSHSDCVPSVVFSPDGSRIASGSYDCTVRVWSTQTGTESAKPFEGHTDKVESVAFSPDGNFILSGSSDHTLRVWDTHTGDTIVGPFWGHTDTVLSVAFSPDSTRLVSGSMDYAVRVWDVCAHTTTKRREGGLNSAHFDLMSPIGTDAAPNYDNNANDVPTNDPPSHNPSLTKQAQIHSALTGTGDFTAHNDGWITSDGVPLFWVPPDFRGHLPFSQNPLVIGPQGSAYIDYRNLKIGEEWSECYVPG